MALTYMIKDTCELRVDTEEAANKLHKDFEEYCHNRGFTLSSWSQTYKCRKSKGEVIDEYYLCKVIIIFTDIKEPTVVFDHIDYDNIYDAINDSVMSVGE